MMFIASNASITSNELSTITQKDDQEKYSLKIKNTLIAYHSYDLEMRAFEE